MGAHQPSARRGLHLRLSSRARAPHTVSLQPVTRTLGARTWQINPQCPAPVADWCAAGFAPPHDGAEVLHHRDKRQRSTTLVRRGNDLVLVKTVKPLRGRVRVRSWFRGRPATREWTWACRFATLGLPVPQPWAFFDGGVHGTSWFVQEGLADAQDLLEFYGRHLQGDTRDAALWTACVRQLGALLAVIHNAGIDHPDLHPGNLLCTGTDAGSFQLWLVDYHSVRPGRGGRARYETSNLTKLVATLLTTFTRAEVRDVLAAYLAHRETAPWASVDALLHAIDTRVPATLQRRARSRARRVFVDSGGFARHTDNGTRVWYRRSCGLQPVLAILDDANAGRLDVHKDRPGSRVSRGTLADGTPVWVKTYTHAGFWKQAEAVIRRNYGRRGWAAAERLYHLGVTAPLGLAYAEERSGLILRRSHLVTQHLTHLTDLDTLLFTGSRVGGNPSRLRHKRALIATVAGAVQRLHTLGIFHRDLSAKNILITNWGTQWRIGFVDIESVRFPWFGLGRRQWMMNLAQLTGLPSTVTLQDRLRFLRAYWAGRKSLRDAMADAPDIAALGTKTQAAWRHREVEARKAGIPGPHLPAPPLRTRVDARNAPGSDATPAPAPPSCGSPR